MSKEVEMALWEKTKLIEGLEARIFNLTDVNIVLAKGATALPESQEREQKEKNSESIADLSKQL